VDVAGRPRGILGGTILIAVGFVYLLLAIGFPYAGSVLFVALGLAFAAAWWIGQRQYVYLVPAGVLLGFGLGLFVPSVLSVTGQYAALIFFAFLALGLVSVFLLAPSRRWPLIPAAIFAALAVIVSLGRGDVIPAQALSYLVPLILIGVGAYLLVEQRA
jgi:hypothetical protein